MDTFNAVNSLFWLKAGDEQGVPCLPVQGAPGWSAATMVTITNNLPSLIIYRSNGY